MRRRVGSAVHGPGRPAKERAPKPPPGVLDMDNFGIVILLLILGAVMLLMFLTQREKSAMRKKGRKRFKPQWKSRSDKKTKRR